MKGFLNVKAYVRGRGIVRTNIGIENGRIAAVDDGADITPIADTGDCLLTAGFIDEHIHGAGGADAMDGGHEALAQISKTLLREGTTAFLATTMTQSGATIKKALNAAAHFKCEGGARLLGVHLEGPFISRKHAGAQPYEYIVPPSVEYFKELQAAAGNAIKMVTLAPEENGGTELVKYLKLTGVTASVGHSGARQGQVAQAVEDGLTCVTHTFNAQSPFHHRDVGVAGSALLYDELFCEAIADTVHVSVDALKLLVKNKPADKLILITDAIRAKGMADGVSELGGQTVRVSNGEARLKDGTLAGSVLKMNIAVKNMVQKCGADIEQTLDYATYNPAKNLGIADEFGLIREEAVADFTLLDENFNVMLTVVNGEILFCADR